MSARCLPKRVHRDKPGDDGRKFGNARCYGLATTPPVIGRGAPLVLGNVIGRRFTVRAARNANACASSASRDQPTLSAVSTVAGARRSASIRIKVGLNEPPPA